MPFLTFRQKIQNSPMTPPAISAWQDDFRNNSENEDFLKSRDFEPLPDQFGIIDKRGRNLIRDVCIIAMRDQIALCARGIAENIRRIESPVKHTQVATH